MPSSFIMSFKSSFNVICVHFLHFYRHGFSQVEIREKTFCLSLFHLCFCGNCPLGLSEPSAHFGHLLLLIVGLLMEKELKFLSYYRLAEGVVEQQPCSYKYTVGARSISWLEDRNCPSLRVLSHTCKNFNTSEASSPQSHVHACTYLHVWTRQAPSHKFLLFYFPPLVWTGSSSSDSSLKDAQRQTVVNLRNLSLDRVLVLCSGQNMMDKLLPESSQSV